MPAQQNKTRQWIWRNRDPEFLSITGSTAEEQYIKRRAWLEKRFLQVCRTWESDREAIHKRAALRRAAAARRNKAKGIEIFALVWSENIKPPESIGFIDACRRLLMDELYCYADFLIDDGVLASDAIQRFQDHSDNFVNLIVRRRWEHWRRQLDYPEAEMEWLQKMLNDAASMIDVEFEEVIWGGKLETGKTLPHGELAEIAMRNPEERSAESVLTGSSDATRAERPKKRGRPEKIPEELKRKALEAPTGKARAQILYQTKYPTPQQVKNVPSILRHYSRKRQPNKG